MSALPLLFVGGDIIIFAFNLILMIGASVVFGVWNPFKHARDEETVLGTLATLLPMFMI